VSLRLCVAWVQAALRIQAVNRGRIARAQVESLKRQQELEREAAAQELVAIKLQASWRGRQARLKVRHGCALARLL